ncbi:cysteine--tRNA ligase, cytoplasmic [Condylostylus longicornis]|uniref:cysteine--tRNA ligase, cytoplasmic n=1 Tax=Condylostylus longicornis TaxID=2530218 RepID=UPI00244E4010|nr:cysteine--tRNA ligase, cytoplasmic [Condylostylus longicornis]
MAKRSQPVWILPKSQEQPKLHLYNSLTRQKEEFIPTNGNNVKWYSCGPTVYDASHMGHARSYISFDILRRVLSDYFGYNVQYVMNITDIDDKIIKRARQNYLYEKYIEEVNSLEQILQDQKHILDKFNATVEKNTDPDKKIMFDKMLEKMTNAVDRLMKAVKSSDVEEIEKSKMNFLSEAKDSISDWLDSKQGNLVNDNSIFESLPRFWENEFHTDMKSLNILPPDVLTRVSEYVPEIVKFIEKIIANGLAYEANGSVYFDVNAFDKREKHHYAKLVPEAYGDIKSLHEGEGDLSIAEDRLTEKKSENDFALWKKSKAGEPKWTSPWGEGRPGWHIECSVMASDICGDTLDIHTGGVDLKFPHHDNELAQSEAYFDKEDWIKYFLHTGHLTIAGCKMSKSLKNFITIQQALSKHTATQLRLVFLLHSWKDTLDYSDNTVEMAIQYEKFLNEFFLNVKDLTRPIGTEKPSENFDRWTLVEKKLQEKFDVTRSAVHNALCDNIDTRTALDCIRDLVSNSNIYIRDNKSNPNKLLLRKIAIYITDLLHIFGAISGPRGGIGFTVGENCTLDSGNFEDAIMPYLTVTAEFRNIIREKAKELKATDILKICDELRDETLVNLGVRLEDKENGKFALKLVDKETLLKDKALKKAIELEKAAEKEKKKAAAAAALAAKEAQKKINPKEMFLHEVDKYSAFDNNGLPTHDIQGKEISKGQLKKLQKLQQQQEQKYNEYLASLNGS